MNVQSHGDEVTVESVRKFLKPHAFGKTVSEIANQFDVEEEIVEETLEKASDRGGVRKVGDNWRWSS